MRARLDSLSREDAAYVLDTFPIAAAATRPPCCYDHTKPMILAYLKAPAAGVTTTDVAF